MPTISYQEIVTPDISESGTVLHSWNYVEGVRVDFDKLYHCVDEGCVDKFMGRVAKNKWLNLCQSKNFPIAEKV